MKIAITKSKNFPFALSVTKTKDGMIAAWLDKNDTALFSVTLDEALVRDRCGPRELSDCANVYLEVDQDKPGIMYVHNKMAATLLTKSGGIRHLRKAQRVCLGQIYIPFSDSPVEDWLFRLNCDEAAKNELPEIYPEVANNEAAFSAVPLTVWPRLRVLGTKKLDDGRTEVSAQLTLAGEDCKRPGVRVFASCETGYISKREVLTDKNGVVKLIARRLDLEPDDEMLVEFGFKFLKNVASVNV